MAELVDALVSGTSGRKAVQVRPLFRAPKEGGHEILPLLVPVAPPRYTYYTLRTQNFKNILYICNNETSTR